MSENKNEEQELDMNQLMLVRREKARQAKSGRKKSI